MPNAPKVSNSPIDEENALIKNKIDIIKKDKSLFVKEKKGPTIFSIKLRKTEYINSKDHKESYEIILINDMVYIEFEIHYRTDHKSFKDASLQVVVEAMSNKYENQISKIDDYFMCKYNLNTTLNKELYNLPRFYLKDNGYTYHDKIYLKALFDYLIEICKANPIKDKDEDEDEEEKEKEEEKTYDCDFSESQKLYLDITKLDIYKIDTGIDTTVTTNPNILRYYYDGEITNFNDLIKHNNEHFKINVDIGTVLNNINSTNISYKPSDDESTDDESTDDKPPSPKKPKITEGGASAPTTCTIYGKKFNLYVKINSEYMTIKQAIKYIAKQEMQKKKEKEKEKLKKLKQLKHLKQLKNKK